MSASFPEAPGRRVSRRAVAVRPRALTRIAVYGHFGTTNFGNESTLLALLSHLRERLPDDSFTCICMHPEVVAEAHGVEGVPISPNLLSTWVPRNRVTRFLRKLCVGIPSEVYRWAKSLAALRDAELLIVPGTGLLTDVDGIFGYGPYNLFRWTLAARLRRCEVAFLGVGAGPIDGVLGRALVRGALSLATFRSYRDHSTKEYLEGIGFRTDGDPVIPDLAFSLSMPAAADEDDGDARAPTVGIGVMGNPWNCGSAGSAQAGAPEYLESLVGLAKWFLGRGYDVRIIIGDRFDVSAVKEFRRRLDEVLPEQVPGRIVERPIFFLDELMSEIAACDLVVATRFHNVIFALLNEKPTIAVSFHHKCESLMRTMGLSEYCVDLHEVDGDLLVRKAQKLEACAEDVKLLIEEATSLYRRELDWHYEQLCGVVAGLRSDAPASLPLEAEAVNR